ncbi:hypothetical protein L2E82_07238 [Cichorium intybus]|uniref:Uncharacterized protein n=1 Tax=Cichorium intybus TaxID=13427 RepID=A0ACB9G528_CICIN|nr:hypothetical protein L2E82_07238 [Cichorium intybus]
MTSTFQPELINAFIQRFLSAQSVLENFIEQVAVAIECKDQATVKQKTIQRTHKVSLKTGSPIESHASTVLTPYAFSKLQEQLVLAPQYASLLVDESYFIVRHHTEINGGSKVIWIPDDEFISCSCHDFEFSGILCRHVLRVLSTNNCFNVPYQYLPIRWRESSQGNDQNAHLLQSMVSTLVSEAMETDERLNFVSGQINMALTRVKEFPGASSDMAYDNSTPDSLILPEVEDSDGIVQGFNRNLNEGLSIGKLKERRLKRRVACCGQFGHDSNDCPLMGSDDMNGDGMGFL